MPVVVEAKEGEGPASPGPSATGLVFATGVLVPAGPRLLAMLCNAGEDEDRFDLALSQG